MTNSPAVTCFGEILWDIFPNRQSLGGAPLNVALRLQNLGSQVLMIGAVGNDSLGSDALDQISKAGLFTGGIAVSDKYPTGTVKVELRHGNARYQIARHVAWDHIKLSADLLSKSSKTQALIHGSLALRDTKNRDKLRQLIALSDFVIFDLNLRKPFFELSNIDSWLRQSQMVKMNEQELEIMANYYGIKASDHADMAMHLLELCALSSTCVTLGEKGAILIWEDQVYRHLGYPTNVVDTVGAGDSFLATLVHFILKGAGPRMALDRACAMGSLVAGKNGANCTVSSSELAELTF